MSTFTISQPLIVVADAKIYWRDVNSAPALAAYSVKMGFTSMALAVLSASNKMDVRHVKIQHIALVVLVDISMFQLVALAHSVLMVVPHALLQFVRAAFPSFISPLVVVPYVPTTVRLASTPLLAFTALLVSTSTPPKAALLAHQ